MKKPTQRRSKGHRLKGVSAREVAQAMSDEIDRLRAMAITPSEAHDILHFGEAMWSPELTAKLRSIAGTP